MKPKEWGFGISTIPLPRARFDFCGQLSSDIFYLMTPGRGKGRITLLCCGRTEERRGTWTWTWDGGYIILMNESTRYKRLGFDDSQGRRAV